MITILRWFVLAQSGSSPQPARGDLNGVQLMRRWLPSRLLGPIALVVTASTLLLSDNAGAALPGKSMGAFGVPTPPAQATKRLESQSEARMRSDIAWDQAPLLEEATKIQQLAVDQGASGFTGTALENGKLVLYWHGRLPAAIESLVKQFAIPVTVRSAAYTFAELNTEARRLSGLPGISGVAALSDFSGLRVSVADGYSIPNVQQLSTTVRLVPGNTRASLAYWQEGSPSVIHRAANGFRG
jgi:hypothetical protein